MTAGNAQDGAAAAARIESLEREIRELRRQLAVHEKARMRRTGSPVGGAFATMQLWRKMQTRLAILTARKPLSPQTSWVLNTGMFDARAYQALAGLTGLSTAEAASHYASVGEREGLRPNPMFDPLAYAEAYPEVLKSDMGLLVHYARHGVVEGRHRSFDIPPKIRQGRRAFDPAKTTILLACHNAGRTGAPILGWNLVRTFGETHNVVAVLLSGGELVETFAEDAAFLVGPLDDAAHTLAGVNFAVGEILKRFDIDVAIMNSIECHPLFYSLALRFVPTVALVHEFAGNVHPPGTMTSALSLVTQVVFDAEVQRRSALDAWPGITRQNQSVFHQGASEVPRARVDKAPNKAEPAHPKPDVGRLVRGPADRPVVLGLGTVAMRKGVDLFVSVAQAVVAELGPDKVRFVWIGDRPNPHPEGVYCDWVADQIKRAGLEDTLVVLDPVDDLTDAFASSALVLSPSRLDPFPNVAMDAALAGVPILCFERANGFAEFLELDEDTRPLVIPYLDVGTAARRIAELLQDEPKRIALGRALKTRSSRDFAMSRYIERLGPVMAAAKVVSGQEQRDTELLIADDTFSSALWLNPFETMSRAAAIRLHVRKAASGQEAAQYSRRPALGFVPQTYAAHHPELEALPFENPLAHWVRGGKLEGAWSHRVTVPDAETRARAGALPRTALHIHLHYPELADGILKALAVNTAALDLFVSTTSDAKAADLALRLQSYKKGPVVIAVAPNRGRDIGPMFTLFVEQLRTYDVVGHIHGKRSLALTSIGLSRDTGVQWHEFLLQHLVGDRFSMVDIILGRFAAEPKLGLVFPEDPNLTGWSLDRDLAVEIAARMDPAMVVPRFIDFPIGTMFWSRPQALQPFFDLKLDWSDYPEEPVPIDGTMLHAIERLFPVVCRHAGFSYETTHIPGVSR